MAVVQWKAAEKETPTETAPKMETPNKDQRTILDWTELVGRRCRTTTETKKKTYDREETTLMAIDSNQNDDTDAEKRRSGDDDRNTGKRSADRAG